ncbi:hypothetical protein BDV96DRAFT_152769 [Lophiotrema nucula]|uniref:Uncharacterized protein n=1 Tax=Lophiotrema nucula TaxID=690887 RepID=A0A6A5Z2M1_9PLEO|nr:hypothetical protein BDV96DRAFT_152769 [Lophiotrema nucula]
MQDTRTHDVTATAHLDVSRTMHTDTTHAIAHQDAFPSYGTLHQPPKYPDHADNPDHNDHRYHDSSNPPQDPHLPRNTPRSPPPHAVIDMPFVPSLEQAPFLYEQLRRDARKRHAPTNRSGFSVCPRILVWALCLTILGVALIWIAWIVMVVSFATCFGDPMKVPALCRHLP